ncbi:MAG: hypothetical protein ACJ8FO_13545, partial [Sphingomicrobium sp.]
PEPEPEPEGAEAVEESVAEEVEEPQEAVVSETEEPVEDEAAEVEETVAAAPETVDEEAAEPVASAVAKAAPGFSKLLDSIAGLTGFYGSQPVKVEPVIEEQTNAAEHADDADDAAAEEPVTEEPIAEEPVAEAPSIEAAPEEIGADEESIEDEPADEPAAPAPPEEPAAKQNQQPTRAPEGTLQSKLVDVRAKADEARMAKLRANAALYEGLAAAYDFALDAEEAPEEYLRLVEAKGLKIQLRSPMKPVVKLAFDGMCDDTTIKQLEAVLAWALDAELPRGSLAEQIEAAGGIGPILKGEAKAA